MTRIITVASLSMLLFTACSDAPTAPEEKPGSADLFAPQNAEATSYSGHAKVVDADLFLLGRVTLVEAGPLPPAGGQAKETLVEASVPGLLTARVLHAATVAQGNRASSESTVADLTLTVANNTIRAAFLRSRAQAECNNDGTATAKGSSEIVELSINDETVTVSGDANQEIGLPGGGVIIINEQNDKSSGNTGDITVNALHVIVPGVADVVIASAHADIACRQVVVCDHSGDFVTGGGWITTPSGSRANFAVAGGIKHGEFWGHLTYIDHGDHLKAKGLEVDGYEVMGDTRIIRGWAEINGVRGRYTATVTDRNEPGRGHDDFHIILNGYTAGNVLAGGNIQLHPKPSNCQ